MRSAASILHLDLDAFFAAVEQRDKPSLRGRPVVVGGIGQRGVVSTASYEARVFGVHSAMPTHEARRLCPNAAFLAGRFRAYRASSAIVMGLLRELSPLVEPLSLDEAFVDLAAGETTDFSPDAVRALAEDLRARLQERTGGLTASVGVASSKFMAKVASELAKPDGVHIVAPGTELETIADLPARTIPGVGPATMERLSRLGVRTVADIRGLSHGEVVRELGRAQGEWVRDLAFARDDRPVVAEREAKSISVEDTFETDLTDRAELDAIIERDARIVAERLARSGLFARTVTLKAKRPDFTILSRSLTLSGATDRAETISRIARGLLDAVPIESGFRLLGVGVANFTEAAQEELFEPDVAGAALHATVDTSEVPEPANPTPTRDADASIRPRWRPSFLPGADVVHDEHGPGWVWGAGLGRVTVRFETAETGPGPVRTFRLEDPALHLADAAPSDGSPADPSGPGWAQSVPGEES
ncbi:MAG TPA: DNA polymerase IV [Propionibacterium sp.]|nr:DNA polymerase IV [Propionibacterium sp.]